MTEPGCPGCGGMAHARQQKVREYSWTARRMVALLKANCGRLSKKAPTPSLLCSDTHPHRLLRRACGSGCWTPSIWTAPCDGPSPTDASSLFWWAQY